MSTVDTMPPDWQSIAYVIECPLCEYNLFGLTQPRCPECGLDFNWPAVLDPNRQRHPYLFEHHPESTVRSFFHTLTGGPAAEGVLDDSASGAALGSVAIDVLCADYFCSGGRALHPGEIRSSRTAGGQVLYPQYSPLRLHADISADLSAIAASAILLRTGFQNAALPPGWIDAASIPELSVAAYFSGDDAARPRATSSHPSLRR